MGTSADVRTSFPPLLLKVLIVMFVFPCFYYLTAIASGLVLMALTWALPDSWQSGWSVAGKIISFGLSLLGGFLASRQLWPKDQERTGGLSISS